MIPFISPSESKYLLMLVQCVDTISTRLEWIWNSLVLILNKLFCIQHFYSFHKKLDLIY